MCGSLGNPSHGQIGYFLLKATGFPELKFLFTYISNRTKALLFKLGYNEKGKKDLNPILLQAAQPTSISIT